MRKLAIFSAGYGGAVFAAVQILPGGVLLPLGGFCIVLYTLLHLLKRFLPDPVRRRALLCCAGMAVGLLWTWGYGRLFLEPARKLDDRTVVLTGTVIGFPEPTDYGGRALVRMELERGSVRTLLYLDEANMGLEPGDRISTIAHCTLATHSSRGEEISYYTAKGIFLTAVAYGELDSHRPDRIPLLCVPAHLNRALTQGIRRTFSPDTAPLVESVVAGNTDHLDDSLITALRRTGLAHAVAVSGLHLAYLTGFLSLLFGRGSRRSAVVSIPMVILFALFVGWTPSVVRAAVMLTLLQLAPLLKREGDTLTSLGFALLVLLVQNPYAAADIGLQLSFGAAVGIHLFSGDLQERMTDRFCLETCENPLQRLWNHLIYFAASGLSVSLGALAFTTPLSAVYFEQVSLIAPLANLAALWAVSWVLIGDLLVGVLGTALPALALICAVPVRMLVMYLMNVIEYLGKIPFASVPSTNFYYLLWLLFVYGVLALTLLLPGKKRQRVSRVAVVAVLAAAVLFTNLTFHTGEMTVQVLDVGQGQSVLLRSGSHIALVDCGGDSYKNAGDIAADQIQSLGRSSIDLLVISHYHLDHANGIPELLSRVDVKEIALPDVEEDSTLRRRILEQAEQKGIPLRFVRQDTVLPFGEGVELTLYPPLGGRDTNELGLTVLCSAEDYDVLLTGDMGTSGEKKLLAYTPLPDVELMVAGHHGSKYSNSQQLLDTVRPDVAVFSVGGDNDYGHPTPEAMERFASVGAEIYRTDLNGTVTITVD